MSFGVANLPADKLRAILRNGVEPKHAPSIQLRVIHENGYAIPIVIAQSCSIPFGSPRNNPYILNGPPFENPTEMPLAFANAFRSSCSVVIDVSLPIADEPIEQCGSCRWDLRRGSL